ncbi:DinB family protein [Adhaeribacter swui]|uniref:DinB family protein n=1 Tax=Adhaeribacter swui TaxID=2086471 RepID=A0A7G7G9Z5_9BACT|nr:DinB family protein [Adhaeribacter swui]QNF33979.1 DinB family protein [Adhaeribacter swui]
MEIYKLDQNLTLYGFPVETFPNHIEAAFDKLISMLPVDPSRPYYGISQCTPAGMVYVAAAPLQPQDNPEPYGLNKYLMEQGDYLAIRVSEWRTKTHTIKSIFENLVADPRCDTNKPCVEIYLNDDEMLCLVKTKFNPESSAHAVAQEAISTFNETALTLQQQFAAFEDDVINQVPFTSSWTAGQVAEHLIISNMGFVEILTGPATETNRPPDELINRMKADFLNVNLKIEAADSVWPQNRVFQKEELLQSFQEVQQLISKAIVSLDLSKTCLAFKIPVYGYLTRLEAVYFVIYHTQRHINQLKKIHWALAKEPV